MDSIDLIVAWLSTTGLRILITAGLGLILLMIVHSALSGVFRRARLAPQISATITKTISMVLLLVVVLVTLEQADLNLNVVWGVLTASFAMVAIGFVAVWSVLSNSLCTLILMMARPFRIGDEIEIIEATGGGGLRGRVVDLNLMYATLEEQDKDGDGQPQTVRVPANVLITKSIRVHPASQAVQLDEHLVTKGDEKAAS
jgi:small-conductance mechanosensitive channel